MAKYIPEYQCNKCKNIFKETRDDAFIAAQLPKCPVCGSEDVRPLHNQTTTEEGNGGVDAKMFKKAVVEPNSILGEESIVEKGKRK